MSPPRPALLSHPLFVDTCTHFPIFWHHFHPSFSWSTNFLCFSEASGIVICLLGDYKKVIFFLEPLSIFPKIKIWKLVPGCCHSKVPLTLTSPAPRTVFFKYIKVGIHTFSTPKAPKISCFRFIFLIFSVFFRFFRCFSYFFQNLKKTLSSNNQIRLGVGYGVLEQVLFLLLLHF